MQEQEKVQAIATMQHTCLMRIREAGPHLHVARGLRRAGPLGRSHDEPFAAAAHHLGRERRSEPWRSESADRTSRAEERKEAATATACRGLKREKKQRPQQQRRKEAATSTATTERSSDRNSTYRGLTTHRGQRKEKNSDRNSNDGKKQRPQQQHRQHIEG